jgi:hypothetical protein
LKHIPVMALMFSIAVASAYAHEREVKMSSSGTAAGSTVDLKIPGTTTGENDFAGKGTLGSYTFRDIEAETGPQTPPSSCSGANFLYTTVAGGAGVFRFQDGSLLNVTITEGVDCIDLVAQQAHCTKLQDHWRNRPIQGRERRSRVCRNNRSGAGRLYRQSRVFCLHWRI